MERDATDDLPLGAIEGFAQREVTGVDTRTSLLIGGDGPPLLLLHGYPQTRMIWKHVAPLLADSFTLVLPDVRGYGRSEKPHGEADHSTYAKRSLAADQVAVMRALGYERFGVVGHDRGGRVAYRMAFDHPDVVQKVAVLDVIPTLEVWENMSATRAVSSFHWQFLAQAEPIPEQLIAASADTFIPYLLQSWARPGFVFDPECYQDYVSCASTPAAIHANAEDYRAGWTIDRQLDREDVENGRKIQQPLLAVCGEHSSHSRESLLRTWRNWADAVDAVEIAGAGHFLPDEAPKAVAAAIRDFFAASGRIPGTRTRTAEGSPLSADVGGDDQNL